MVGTRKSKKYFNIGMVWDNQLGIMGSQSISFKMNAYLQASFYHLISWILLCLTSLRRILCYDKVEIRSRIKSSYFTNYPVWPQQTAVCIQRWSDSVVSGIGKNIFWHTALVCVQCQWLGWLQSRLSALKGITHGGFYIYINLGILSLCTEPWHDTRCMRIACS